MNSRGEREKQREWADRLYEDYAHVCFTYRLKLARPVLLVQNLPNHWGLWDPVTRTITISSRLIENYSWDVVVEILKHEMAHQMVHDLFKSEEGHGVLFKSACDRLGVVDWARRAETDIAAPIEKWQEEAVTPDQDRLLRRVEKLLALATSSNEHEALLAMQKVQELYARHNIDRLRESRPSRHVYLLIHTGKKRIERHHFMIASILNEHFFVRVVHSSLYHAVDRCEYKVIELLGTRENVQMAEYVYHFLWNQIHVRWKEYRAVHKKSGRSKSSYFLGILSGFRDKLDHAHQKKQDIGATASSGTALLVPDDKMLEAFVDYRYPRLVSFRRERRLGDPDSFEAGKKEGWRLVLHRGLSHESGNHGKLLRGSSS